MENVHPCTPVHPCAPLHGAGGAPWSCPSCTTPQWSSQPNFEKNPFTGTEIEVCIPPLVVNPSIVQFDDRLFIVHENCKLRIPAEHVLYTNCCFCFVLTFRTSLVHNIFCRCCELLKKIYLYLYIFNFKNLFYILFCIPNDQIS